MLTVSATGLVKSESASLQLSILANESEAQRDKNRNSEKTIDKIRQKYGDSAIIKGAVLDTDIGIYTAHKDK